MKSRECITAIFVVWALCLSSLGGITQVEEVVNRILES